MKIRWWAAVIAGLAIAGAAGIGATLAQETPEAGSGPTFLERVAGKLGIESETLRDAITSSANDEVDERVAAGELTQERADAIKERIANADGEGFFRPGFHGPGRGMIAHHLQLDALGDFLGISTEELRTELQADGATLATVAEAHGKSREELKTFLTDEARSRLDDAVANGRITQEQADEKLGEFESRLDAIIDNDAPFWRDVDRRMGPGPGFVPGDELPDSDEAPSATPSGVS